MEFRIKPKDPTRGTAALRRAARLSALVKALAIAAIGVAAVAFDTNLFAQSGVSVHPIADPAVDSGIALANAHAGGVLQPSAPNAWGGPRTGSEATLSDRVVDYKIAATLDPVKHTVDGKETLTWRNRSDREVRSVYLHLYLNAFEGEHSTFYTEKRLLNSGFRSDVDTKEGEWGHIELRTVSQGGAKVGWSFVHPDGGPMTDHTVVRLDLPAAVAPGASTALDISFFDQLPRVVARTGYFGSFHLIGQWFPKIGVLELPGERGATALRWNVHEFHLNSEFYADFGSYDVQMTVPQDYTVGATGEAQGAPAIKDGMATHRYVQGDVHDFAWTADKRTAPPLEETWTGPGSPSVKVRVLFAPEYQSNAAPAMKAAKDSLTYFSQTLGPYPYKTLTVVLPPYNATEAGGMEYPTFFTADSFANLQSDTIASFMLDFVTIHEFGHGYFYGILASNEFEEPMLDEGLNEYWDHRMIRDRGQLIHATTPFLKAIGFHPTWESFDIERTAAPREAPADALAQNAYDRLQGIGPIYVRTATTMHDLERTLGKETIERAFKEYYKRWKFRHPSVADLRETIADVSGQRALVEAVFAQQVYKVSKIDDSIDQLTSVEELPQPGTHQISGKWVEETQKDIDKRVEAERKAWKSAHPDAREGTGPYPFRTTVLLRRRGSPVPQTVEVRFADGSVETAQWNDELNWKKLSFIKPAKAVSAELDPKGQHYLDVNKLDDSRTIKADGSASRRWSADFAAIVNLLFSLIATV